MTEEKDTKDEYKMNSNYIISLIVKNIFFDSLKDYSVVTKNNQRFIVIFIKGNLFLAKLISLKMIINSRKCLIMSNMLSKKTDCLL